MDHAGFDTYSSVWRAKHVFGADRIIVVTQDFPLPRALFVARSLGMAAEGASAVAVDRRPHHEGPRIDLRGDGNVIAG